MQNNPTWPDISFLIYLFIYDAAFKRWVGEGLVQVIIVVILLATDFNRFSEINNFQLVLTICLVNQDIIGFEVSMDDSTFLEFRNTV